MRALSLLFFAALLALPARADDLAARNAEGVDHYKAGRFAEAVDAFEKALAAAPNEPTIKLNLGRSFLALGLQQMKARALSDAADAFRKAIDTLPEQMEPRILHAETLAQLDRVDDGISVLEEALRLLPPTAPATRAIGFLLYRSGRREQALKRWRESIALEPDQPDLAAWIERVEKEADSERNFARSAGSAFQVNYDLREHPEMGRTVLGILEEALKDVSADLGLFPHSIIDVVLLPDRTFREVNEVPAWVGGLYDGRIKFPAGNLEGDTEHLQRLARHELTHALLHDTAPDSPGWLEEGLAQMMEGRPPEAADTTVREAAHDGRLFPIEKLSGSFVSIPDPAQVVLAYAESISFCRYLRTRYGRYTLRLYLDKLSGAAAESAFEDAFGAPLGAVTEEWQKSL